MANEQYTLALSGGRRCGADKKNVANKEGSKLRLERSLPEIEPKHLPFLHTQ